MEIEAPSIPEYAQEQMPDETESFSQGFRELLQKALMTLRPDLKEACSVSLSIIAAVMLVSFLKSFSDNVKTTLVLAGITVIAAALLLHGVVCLLMLLSYINYTAPEEQPPLKDALPQHHDK